METGEHAPVLTGPVRYLVEHLDRAIKAQERKITELAQELERARAVQEQQLASIRKLTGWTR